MNQTPRQQIEAATKDCQVQTIKSYELAQTEPLAETLLQESWLAAKVRATDAILAVIKGLPAMQLKPEKTDGLLNAANVVHNITVRQILAELEATK